MNAVYCHSVQSVQLSAQKSIAVVKTKIESDLYVGTCAIGAQSLVIHDDNKPVNVFGFNLKAG